ncbi:uncharacterized protein LOC117787561 [Drosophila innubila]|uniref:uncharacterized protein LOC117787561 n=1 Tax=Drosophila innubila TaxID=198719 RepID=UPI00148B4B82|nr:uncharacterized protein LOC117787561 [Drosophila innubila]
MFKSSFTILSALFMLSLCILIKAAPYQELEPRKGHVPVYIRHGDEALSQIHPGLAEAFKEGSSQTLQAENLVKEVLPTNQSPTESETTTPKIQSSTVSDIASFDVIKAMQE